MKIVIGGQLRKKEIANYINNNYKNFEVKIMSDIDAVLAIQNNEYDIYLGACDTGGGGALAMAISILGMEKTKTIATQSSTKSFAEINNYLNKGIIAFGFVESEWEHCTKSILKSLEEKHG